MRFELGNNLAPTDGLRSNSLEKAVCNEISTECYEVVQRTVAMFSSGHSKFIHGVSVCDVDKRKAKPTAAAGSKINSNSNDQASRDGMHRHTGSPDVGQKALVSLAAQARSTPPRAYPAFLTPWPRNDTA